MSKSTKDATIIVNGESRALAQPIALSELLKELEFTTKALAVEVNLELVPRAEHEAFQIKSGDELEIVTLAGGG